MDGTRLKLVALELFPPPKKWKQEVSKALNVPKATIETWLIIDKVPRMADVALECLLSHKHKESK